MKAMITLGLALLISACSAAPKPVTPKQRDYYDPNCQRQQKQVRFGQSAEIDSQNFNRAHCKSLGYDVVY